MSPFMRVAVGTSQSEISQLRLATSRSGQDMVDLKTTNLELSRKLTVFATIVSTLDHGFPERYRYLAHASDTKPGSAARRPAKHAWDSRLSSIRFCAKPTSDRSTASLA